MSIGNDKLLEVLQRYWGYDSFVPCRRRSFRSVCQGRDTLALMPTGGGKSLTYQVPDDAARRFVHRRHTADRPDEGPGSTASGGSASTRRRSIRDFRCGRSDIVLDNCVYGDVKSSTWLPNGS